MLRYRLGTLLIVLATVPPILAWAWMYQVVSDVVVTLGVAALGALSLWASA